jgi:hypothetical protein
MGPGFQLSKKKIFKLLKGGIRILVLITYLLSVLGVPSLAVHAGVTMQEEDEHPENDRAGDFYTYLPLIMGGSGTLPTDITLIGDTIDENMAIDTVIGTLSTADAGVGDTHTYSLVAGAGDDNNASFNIAGDQLRSSEVFNYEVKDTYTIRIQTMDQVGLTYQESFIIIILDVDDKPVADTQTVSTIEDQTLSITLTGSDEDGDPLTFLLATLPDHGTLYEDGDPLNLVPLPPVGGTVRVEKDLVYIPDDDFLGVDSFDFLVSANDALSDPAAVNINVNDGTAPTLDITGATDNGDPMAGDLETGYILETTNDPEMDHLIQFAEGTGASEPLADDYFGLYLVDSTVSAADLKAYYVAHGTPSEPIDFLGYLQDAADGLNPFVYIKGTTVRLVDAAKWDLLAEEHDMTVPDDFPLGTYTVEGEIEDEAGNKTTVTLILVVDEKTYPAWELEIDHEEGVLSGDWESDNGGGFVGVSAGAALAGTDYGLWADSAEGTSQYGYLHFPQVEANTVRLRFYVDVRNLTPAVGYMHILGVKSINEENHIFYIRLRYNGSQYFIRFDAKADGDDDYPLTSVVGSISTTAENFVEVMIVRADPGQSNGEAYLWVNGSLDDSATDVDNDQQFTNLGFIEAGVFSKMGTWSGDIHLDEIKVNNTGEEIGPLGGTTQNGADSFDGQSNLTEQDLF